MVAGDVFQHRLDECFGKLEQVIIIAGDIMVIGYKLHHSNHGQAFTNLLQTVKECNVKCKYDKLQYKQNEVEFFGDLHNKQMQAKQRQSGCNCIHAITNQQKACTVLYGHDQLLAKVLC